MFLSFHLISSILKGVFWKALYCVSFIMMYSNKEVVLWRFNPYNIVKKITEVKLPTSWPVKCPQSVRVNFSVQDELNGLHGPEEQRRPCYEVWRKKNNTCFEISKIALELIFFLAVIV